MKKYGFTLSEVLITLGIIGVVAALTLPVLIKNHKKHVTENQLKTAYSIFSQAINSAKAEYGDVSNWDDTLSDNDIADKYITPYLTIIKTKTGSMGMHTLYANNTGGYLMAWSSSSNIYYLKNGMRFKVSNQMQAWNFGYNLYITIDINGDKGPNILGYDGFVFVVNKKNNQLLPKGANGTNADGRNYSDSDLRDNCSNNSSSWIYYWGETCAELIRRNNWKIPDDYPW